MGKGRNKRNKRQKKSSAANKQFKKHHKKEIEVLSPDFVAHQMEVGARLFDLGFFPGFEHCPYFRKNFQDKLYRNIQHLMDNRDEEQNNHPYHHLYLAESLLKLGYSALGRSFEQDFSDEVGFLRMLFKEYKFANPKQYVKYEEFKESQGLEERVRVLKSHSGGLLKVKKEYLKMLRDGAYAIKVCSEHPKDELTGFHRKHYKTLNELKEDFYQIAALFKGCC